MRKVTIGAVQMRCCADAAKNLEHAEELARRAAAAGANVILLPELFERPYFCQERRYEFYSYAQEPERTLRCSDSAPLQRSLARSYP